MTFKPPPFKEPGFWSYTIYDAANLYTVPNPINRYSLGSDDKLIVNPDGRITLYLQSESPGKDKEAPAADAQVRPLPRRHPGLRAAAAIYRRCLRSEGL
jgi:hypothetical protein